MVARLAEALGVGMPELLAGETGPEESLAALRSQALSNLGAAVAKADRLSLEMFAMLGRLTNAALARNR
jgi:hypothetical protein